MPNKKLNRTQTHWLRFAIIANKFVPFSLGRYMYKKTLISIIFLFLFGCSTMDNMVGFGVSFDKVVSKECVTTILSNMQGVSGFKEVGSGVKFVSQKYKVDFDYVLKGSLVSGYEVTIDGMFLGQSNATFIQNSHSLQKRLHGSIEQGCY